MGMARSQLYEMGEEAWKAANALSDARDKLDGPGDKDQGIRVDGKANIVPSNPDGIAFRRHTARSAAHRLPDRAIRCRQRRLLRHLENHVRQNPLWRPRARLQSLRQCVIRLAELKIRKRAEKGLIGVEFSRQSRPCLCQSGKVLARFTMTRQ
jgi:hypothetical protein